MQSPKSLLFVMFSMLILLASCSRHVDKTVPETLLTADNVLWVSPDSAVHILNTISPDSLSPFALAFYRMVYEHARLKTAREVSMENIQQSKDFFLKHKDNRMAGEAAYILGAVCDSKADNYGATRQLKQAESLLFSSRQTDSVPPVLLGMVCYKLGITFESDWLYKEANEYYRRALPFFQQTPYHLYIACTLRDIARTMGRGENAQMPSDDTGSLASRRDSLFRMALQEASMLSDTTIYLDILDYAITFSQERDTAALLRISRYMTNVLHQPRYAGELADYYISCGKLDSARQCLMLYAKDTLSQTWSKDRWHYLNSKYLLHTGNSRQAYLQLEDLYNNRQRQLVKDGQAKTYAIARQYDVLKEKEENLRLTVYQQRLYILIAVLIGVVISVALLWLLYHQRSRRKEALQQAQIQMLDQELAARRETLRRILSERVELTRKMQLSEIMQGRRKDELPKWAQEFIEQNLITSDSQWNLFLQEFNAASSNLLDRLKDEYPQLTKTDLLISALILTGLSIQDICILLNQAKRTIWSRRLRIKTHLCLTENDNLDQWLRLRLQNNNPLPQS